MKSPLAAAALAAGLSFASSAGAAVFVVDALAHSSDSGAGTGLDRHCFRVQFGGASDHRRP